jgi:hypothetical protein
MSSESSESVESSETPAPAKPRPWLRRQSRLLLWSLAAGVAYGAFARAAFALDLFKDLFGVMTVAFLFLVPAAIGFATVFLGERQERWSWWAKLFFPWLPALICLAGALLLAWEGLICIVLWVPLFLVTSTLGGVIAGIAGAVARSRRARSATLAGCLLLPFAVAPLEHLRALPDERRVVPNVIDIHADPATVWANIARVPAIQPAELGFTWTHLMGFPRPIAATLSREGVGGVRHATFERGVLFVETVTAWEPQRRLAFAIAADPASIPAAALDQHVTVGGPYFDVLDGEYRIEPLGPGRVRLHLQSTHRLSTRFNAYSGLWTDFILRDVQDAILEVLKRRCEAGRRPAADGSWTATP